MTTTTLTVPREGLSRLFLRFLRIGLPVWGGPVAHIALIRQALGCARTS